MATEVNYVKFAKAIDEIYEQYIKTDESAYLYSIPSTALQTITKEELGNTIITLLKVYSNYVCEETENDR